MLVIPYICQISVENGHGVGLAAGGLCLSAGAGELLLPATAESFLSPGSALDGGRNPHHPGWAHLPGGVPSPVHPAPPFSPPPSGAFKPLGRELIAQGRVHAESLALPGLDQARLVQTSFGSCLLLRQGTQVWRVSLNHMEDGGFGPPALWQEAVLRSLGITVPA